MKTKIESYGWSWPTWYMATNFLDILTEENMNDRKLSIHFGATGPSETTFTSCN